MQGWQAELARMAGYTPRRSPNAPVTANTGLDVADLRLVYNYGANLTSYDYYYDKNS